MPAGNIVMIAASQNPNVMPAYRQAFPGLHLGGDEAPPSVPRSST